MNEWIKWRHFKKYLSSDLYFIWEKENKVDDLNLFNNSSDESDEWEWSVPITKDDINSLDYHKTQFKSYKLLNEEYVKSIEEEYGKSKVYIIKSIKIEEAIEETKKIIDDNKYDFIIDPIFEYEGAISCSKGLDTKKRIAYDLKYSTTTNKSDIFKAYYNFNIIDKEYELNDYGIYVLSPFKNPGKNMMENYSKNFERLSANDIFFIKLFSINYIGKVSSTTFSMSSQELESKFISSIEKKICMKSHFQEQYIDKLSEEKKGKNIYDPIMKEYVDKILRPDKNILLSIFDTIHFFNGPFDLNIFNKFTKDMKGMDDILLRMKKDIFNNYFVKKMNNLPIDFDEIINKIKDSKEIKEISEINQELLSRIFLGFENSDEIIDKHYSLLSGVSGKL